MRHGKITREEAIKIMGEKLVERLDWKSCDLTGRRQTDGDKATEYAASLSGIALDNGKERTLVAYYYTTPEQEQEIADADGDGGVIDWEIEGYEIY